MNSNLIALCSRVTRRQRRNSAIYNYKQTHCIRVVQVDISDTKELRRVTVCGKSVLCYRRANRAPCSRLILAAHSALMAINDGHERGTVGEIINLYRRNYVSPYCRGCR